MSEQIRFESYNDNSILRVDYSGLSENEMIQTLDRAAAIGFEKEQLLILADFSRTPHSKKFNQKIKAHGLNYSKKVKDPIIAVLGIDSMLKG